MSSAALQATHHPPHASRAAAWHAVPTVKQRTVRRRRGAAHPAASAASLPADGSGSAPDEAVAAASWGGDTEVRAAAEVVPAAAGEGAPAAAAAEPQSSGLLGWLWERRRRTKSEWQRRVGSLGLSAVLAYGLLDCLTSAVAFLLCFLAYEARTVGQGPTWPAAQRSCPRFCCWCEWQEGQRGQGRAGRGEGERVCACVLESWHGSC
ncbi:hypothetical protein ABPG75_012586 [Micractinium tetrahymenae]